MSGYLPGSTAAVRFLDAKRFAAEARFRLAVISDISAIRAEPGTRLAWDHLAMILEMMRRRKLEFSVRRLIIEKFGIDAPESARSLQRLADYAYRLGDVNSAKKYLVSAFRANPSEVKWLRNSMWLHQSQNPLIGPSDFKECLSKIRPLTPVELEVIDYRETKRRSVYARALGLGDANLSGVDFGRSGISKDRTGNGGPRVAVLISGQLRDYVQGLKNIKHFLAAPLDADIFIHTWARTGIPRIGRVLSKEFASHLRSRGLPVDESLADNFPVINKVFGDEFPSMADISGISSAVSIVIENEPDSLKKNRSIGDVEFPIKWKNYSYGSLPMYYKIKKCFEIMEQYERIHNFKYDVVVRVRPDLIFESRLPKQIVFEALRTRCVYVNALSIDHCDDQFAVGQRDIMEKYCGLFDYLPDYWSERGGVPGATMGLGENILFQHIFYEGLQLATIPWNKAPSLLNRKIEYRDVLALSQRRDISPEERSALQTVLGGENALISSM